jgi:phospholipase C
MSIRFSYFAIAAMTVAACGGDDSNHQGDAGAVDASTDSSLADAGQTDATLPPADGGDAGAGDAGLSEGGGDAGHADSGPTEGGAGDAGAPLSSLKHLVIIYMENHSFDNLLGTYPGAEGLSSPGATIAQVQPDGGPYATLPQTDPHVPATLPNAPFDLSVYFDAGQQEDDPVHRFYQEQWQINGGKMDSFAAVSNVEGLAMGYWPTSKIPLYAFAQSHAAQVTVCDHFFHAAFGGSFLNHFWFVAARTPQFPDAGADLLVQLAADGGVVVDNNVTPDGYAINTLYSVNFYPAGTPADQLVPEQAFPTIGDLLTGAGVDWNWYSGGWYDAVGPDGGAPHPSPYFAYHHQPFVYFAKYAPGTPGYAHLKDESDFVAAAAAGALPPVSFVKPLDNYAEHPAEGDIFDAENHAVGLITDVMNGPSWNDTVVVLTYDENGGQWDHVAPPSSAPGADRWGPGTRVPALIVSPFARSGVDSTRYDTTALLTLIEKRWGLASMTSRDAAQADMTTHAMTFAP